MWCIVRKMVVNVERLKVDISFLSDYAHCILFVSDYSEAEPLCLYIICMYNFEHVLCIWVLPSVLPPIF